MNLDDKTGIYYYNFDMTVMQKDGIELRVKNRNKEVIIDFYITDVKAGYEAHYKDLEDALNDFIKTLTKREKENN